MLFRPAQSIYPDLNKIITSADITQFREQLQNIMYTHCGIIRNEITLQEGEGKLLDLKNNIEHCENYSPSSPSYSHVIKWFELNNMIILGLSLIRSAIYRKESRGAHYREDYPNTSIKWGQDKNNRGYNMNLREIQYKKIIENALLEDFQKGGDLTTDALIPEHAIGDTVLRAREPGVIAGLDASLYAFKVLDQDIKFEYYKK